MRMSPSSFGIWLVALASVLVAFPAIAQVESSATPEASQDPACLLGEWEALELGPFVEKSFPGVMGIKGIRYERSEGSLLFFYLADGSQRIVADEYRVDVVADVRFVGDVDAAIVFDGKITGRWTVEGDVVALMESDRSEFSVNAELPFGTIGVDAGDFFGDGSSRFTCDAQELAIYPDPEIDVPIRFRRPSGTPTPEPATPAST